MKSPIARVLILLTIALSLSISVTAAENTKKESSMTCSIGEFEFETNEIRDLGDGVDALIIYENTPSLGTLNIVMKRGADYVIVNFLPENNSGVEFATTSHLFRRDGKVLPSSSLVTIYSQMSGPLTVKCDFEY